MRYVDTIWEKRNLGIDSCQYIIEPDDDIVAVLENIKKCGKEYIEVQVNVGEIIQLWELENNGFHFTETIYELVMNRDDIVIPKSYYRLKRDLSYTVSNDMELHEILEQIKSGEMFLTDKIALNPRFGPKDAGRRYYYWMQDMLKQGGICCSFKFREELVGFEMIRVIDEAGHIAEQALGGIFSTVKVPGLGSMIVPVRADYMKDIGLTKFVTHVSSNNFSVMRLHLSTGYRLASSKYLLVRQC